MKTNRLILSFLMVMLFAGVMTIVSEQNIVLAQTNLLTNPSFEGGYSSYIPQTPEQQASCPVGECTTAQMPAGWFPWWVPQTSDNEPWENRMPEFKPVCPFEPCPYTDRLKDGPQALQYFTFHSTHTAGLWQRVTVPNNANLKFAVWGQAWSSASDKTYSDFPTPVNMRIGIDPAGGTNPFSGSVVWSGFANPYDQYVPFEVDATAQGTTVTVFMWSQPQEARKHNDIYWDGASLVANGAGAPAPAAPAPAAGGGASSGGGAVASAPPAPVFQLGPTPTPNAEGIIQISVQPGDSLWAIAARAGLSLDEILDFNGLTRNSFINVGDTLIIGYGDAGAAAEAAAETAEETTAEGGTPAEGEAQTEGAEEAPVEEAVAEPTPEPTPVPVITTGEICLLAFDDTNGDGFYEGEALKSNVALTIADGQSVVSNYITNGSEPFCIDGLESGTYRISRSIVPGETVTNAADWGVSLAPGMSVNIEFGSKIEAFDAAAETVAMAEPAAESGAADDSAASITVDESAAADAGGNNLRGWIVGIILGVAALLFLGIGFVVMSARRGTS
jgi:hypothetical protein